MKLSQYFRDKLRDILAKRTERTQMKDMPPDDDAPKEMGKACRSDEEGVGTAHAVKNASGKPVCGRCGGAIVLVNEIKGTQACANVKCGAKIVD